MLTFIPSGVCTKEINVEIVNNKIMDVQFIGGCPGSTKALGVLIKGKPVNEVIEALSGINCGEKGTSCPDQLVKCLKTQFKK